VTKLAVAVAFLALNFYTYHFLATQAVTPPRTPFSEFPLEPGDGWVCPQREGMEQQVLDNLGVTDFLLCNFGNPERHELVNVYVGYHQSQVREEGGGSGENSIHPPAHCLPGSGWDIIHHETVPLDLPGLPQHPATAKRLVVARGESRALVYYWYQSRGRVISEDWRKVVYVGLDRALRGRTDGSLVRFTVPFRKNGIDRAERSFRSLASQIVARLPAYVPGRDAE
jgi:EpsI family protein